MKKKEGKMFIKKITFQMENDFKAIFCCEHCGYTYEKWGYNNDYYWKFILPKQKCPECGLEGDDKITACITKEKDMKMLTNEKVEIELKDMKRDMAIEIGKVLANGKKTCWDMESAVEKVLQKYDSSFDSSEFSHMVSLAIEEGKKRLAIKTMAENLADEVLKKFIDTYKLNTTESDYNIFINDISEVLMRAFKYGIEQD